ncbi:hypothetical protein [Occultella kanbiaonis]|uniref:hypothetical protein n=1 Tax=Occultella kanbiaonis TaxID=2675754 RepID=UPI0012B93F8A|nr:hypothetical protein [Occultella kanbiaonis]
MLVEEEFDTYVWIKDGSEGPVVCVCGPLSLRAAKLLIAAIAHEGSHAVLTIDLGQATFAEARAVRYLVEEVNEYRRRGSNIQVHGSCINLLLLGVSHSE